MSANRSQAYQLKAIRFQNTARNILLQNENGPCPLLAAANALLLRGVIKLDPVCVRNGVASTDDVVNMLANRALTAGNRETANQTVASDSSHHAEYHLNEVLSLLPSLQHGMDVNPKFTSGPTGVEYTNNLATFDLLGVELVHGWLLDPQDIETVSGVESKTYNELIETVIHGNDAREAVQKLEAQLFEKEQILEEDVVPEGQETKTGDDHDESESMNASGVREEESAQSDTNREQAVQKLEAQLCEKEKIIEEDVVLDGEETKTGDDHVESESMDASGIGEEESAQSNTDQEHCSGGLSAKESSPEIPGQETKTGVEHVESESIDASGIGEEESAAQSNTDQEQCSGDLPAKESSPGIPDQKDVENENVSNTEQLQKSFTGEEKVALQKEIIDTRGKISELSLQITKSEVANAFLTSSGHQLTYHGLEQLHKHLGNDALCVFFRNNHFATLTKHDGVLYLLATDLGYANIPEIVWEKLDNIDGDTSYANEFFAKPTPRAELKPAAGPTIAPELMLAQRSQAETDYQLALAMSKGAANPGRMDDDEGRLIQAAKELSLKTYHGDDDAAVNVDANSNASTSNSGIDSDLEVAMAYQRAQEQSEHESEQLARQLQELEYARQRPAANPRRPARAAPAAKSASTTSNCTIS